MDVSSDRRYVGVAGFWSPTRVVGSWLSLVQQMADSQDRTAQEQSRPGVTHDDTYLLATSRLVAMDRALHAGRLVLAEKTLLQTPLRVREQRGAVRAGFPTAMVVAAKQPDHCFDSSTFATATLGSHLHAIATEQSPGHVPPHAPVAKMPPGKFRDSER